MNTTHDPDANMIALRDKLEKHMVAHTPLEIIYFGGGKPGMLRTITPLRYGENRERIYVIGLCHQSEIEKTFRLDRMHLPEPPLVDGLNDVRVINQCLGDQRMIIGMLTQIARLGNTPMEKALAMHLVKQGQFESFFDEYSYGGYTLELKFTSTTIYLSLGYEADDCELMHYHFTPESLPRLKPEIATHYSLYVDSAIQTISPRYDQSESETLNDVT